MQRITSLVARLAEMEEWFSGVKAEAERERRMREQSVQQLGIMQERVELLHGRVKDRKRRIGPYGGVWPIYRRPLAMISSLRMVGYRRHAIDCGLWQQGCPQGAGSSGASGGRGGRARTEFEQCEGGLGMKARYSLYREKAIFCCCVAVDCSGANAGYPVPTACHRTEPSRTQNTVLSRPLRQNLCPRLLLRTDVEAVLRDSGAPADIQALETLAALCKGDQAVIAKAAASIRLEDLQSGARGRQGLGRFVGDARACVDRQRFEKATSTREAADTHVGDAATPSKVDLAQIARILSERLQGHVRDVTAREEEMAEQRAPHCQHHQAVVIHLEACNVEPRQLLTRHRNRRDAFVADWSVHQIERLEVWTPLHEPSDRSIAKVLAI